MNIKLKKKYHNQLNELIFYYKQCNYKKIITTFKPLKNNYPDNAKIYNIVGIAHFSLGNFNQAINYYKKAIDINPTYDKAYCNMGIVLVRLKRFQEAIIFYKKALKINKKYFEVYNNLGIILGQINKFKDAVSSFEKAIKIKPDYVEAHCNIIEIFNRHNKLVDLKNALHKAKFNCKKNNYLILFRTAEFSYRQGDYKEAINLLKKIKFDKKSYQFKNSYLELLGKTYDKLNQFENAFVSFKTKNEITFNFLDTKKISANNFYKETLGLINFWSSYNKYNLLNNPSKYDKFNLCFLVGFPRSGTTLLDSILSSHKHIQVIEEKSMIFKMKEKFNLIKSNSHIDRLPKNQIISLRDIYFNELKKFTNVSTSKKIIIDKLPLNIRYIGLIHSVFPRAKFILSLRHPCDCVLSCFMQSFNMNDAMANFLTLNQAAKLYAAIMTLWKIYNERLKFNFHIVKYENLIKNLKGTCEPLIKFLDLNWDNNIMEYNNLVLNKDKINTPSYNQVVQPLYKQACNRWINYKQHMEHVLPTLNPWIKYFNYN